MSSLTKESQEFLDAVKATPVKPIWEFTPEEARAGMLATTQAFGAPLIEVDRVEDFFVPSQHGDHKIQIRLYVPKKLNRKGLFIYAHGGGWMRGDIPTYDTNMRLFAETFGIAVVSIEYRLSPEYKFPCHQHDVYDAYLWCRSHLNDLGVEEGRIYLSGDSGGANVTLGVVCMLIDHKQPLPDQYIGIYPPTDLRMEYESYKTYATDHLLTTEAVDFYVTQYLRSPEDRLNAYASPFLHPKLDQFPPTLIVTAEADPLFGEQEAFVEKLISCGVTVKQEIYKGTIHPFVLLAGVFPEAQQALQWIDDNLIT
jgi:acetyl esterase